MKAFYCFLILYIIFCFRTNAQNTYLQSTLLGYSEDSNCQLYMDDAGNAYAIINSRYDINFHGQLFARHGSGEYSVIGKFDNSGKMLWARTISTAANPANNPTDIIYDLKIDANQNVYISGAGGGITLDDGTLLSAGTFLIKFDGKGNTLWGVISANTQNMTSMTGGPIALAKDGVYWSSVFYGRLQLQNYVFNTTDPNNSAPNGFVAKVNSAGKITSMYHDLSVGSIPQIMVAAENGNASVVFSRGGPPKYRVMLDANCISLSDVPFFTYGDFPAAVRTFKNGYEMLTSIYGRDKNGFYPLGFYDVKFDRNLNITDSTKLFPNAVNDRIIYDAINNNNNGYYLNSPTQVLSNKFDWILMDGNFNQTILKPEVRSLSGEDAFTRNFVKMSGDTLNMLMRHSDVYTTGFVFNRQSYTVPYNLDEGYFWVKYEYQDPDSCKKITAEVLQNGKEGTQDVMIKFKLPSTCPASEDIIIDTKLEKPETNENDFILPPTVIIKKGTFEAVLKIPVIDDYYIENTETFTVDLTVRPTSAGYVVLTNTTFIIEDNDNTPANKLFTITYTPQITEGDTAGKITVALPKHIWLKQGLHFIFIADTAAHQATPGADYNSLNITMPPDTNQVTFNVKAVADKLIEGDEFISGTLVADTSSFGPFTPVSNFLKIKIIDVDNTEANRVIDVTTVADSVLENNKMAAYLQVAAPYRLQDPLLVTITPLNWFSFLQQSTGQLVIDSLATKKLLTITYPDDHVIRADKEITLGFSATDSYAGSFKFRQNNNLMSDKLQLTAVDNDIQQAYFQLQPLALTLKEGSTGYVNVKLPDDYVMESSTAINYTWLGLGINDDKRIGPIINAVVLPSFQNSLRIALNILDDNIANPYNFRQIVFSAINSDFNNRPFNITDSVSVQITDNEIGVLAIPNTFTPNGDGINDTWAIRGLTEGDNVNLSVWNRYGSLVYQRSKYAPWDGTYKGNAVPPGTYYYVISINEKIAASGSVTIVK